MEVYGFEGTGFQAIGTGCMVSRVWGTWFREYGVHSFESTGSIVSRVQGTGYIVSQYLL